MKKGLAVILVLVLVFGACSTVFAAEKKNPARDAANYTGNVVTGSVNTVGEAAKGTTETAVSPIVAFWRSLIGKGKPRNVVTDPLEKGGKTVYDTTVNTGKTVAGQKK